MKRNEHYFRKSTVQPSIFSNENESTMPKAETNREHFFGSLLLYDTIMLLTYDNHNRSECRLFKKVIKEMSPKELIKWLDSPIDSRFNW